MAPIVLKVKGNMQSLPFGNLDSTDDLSKTWRVCTKVKDSLENGSRLENLSWRLWFAHNINKNNNNNNNNESLSANKKTIKVPENIDFKAEKKNKKAELMQVEYKRKLSLQQKKQATEMIYQQQQQTAIVEPLIQQYYNNQQKREEFTLQQFTSDQAGDQVIELDDIFKSFGGDMQAYLDPSQDNPTSQQLDNLINESWPISSSSASSIHDPYNDSLIHSNATSPVQLSFPSTMTTQPPPPPMYSQQQEYSDYNGGYNNDLQGSALYVSSEAMPPIPIGTLHNKLLATLPRETLENAGRLLLSNTTIDEEPEEIDDIMNDLPPQPITTISSTTTTMYHQSTPNTPYTSSSSSFTPVTFNPQPQQQQQQQMNESSYRFFMPPPSQPMNHHVPSSSYSFSHHHPSQQHSKSLPPSRATSPPPCDTGGSSSSASSSPISPSSNSPQRRATAPINSSPSEGKAPICSNCSTASTPLWRRSANDELLCNACGLYLKLHNAPRPKYLKPQSLRKDLKGEDENIIQPLCSNCGTSTTPLWRRDLEGASLCNACGLYLKLHHEKRPLSMKTDNIKKRQRCDNNNNNSTNKSSSSVQQTTTPLSSSKKNRIVEEPLTTTVTFDSTYQYMEDVIPNNNNNNNSSQDYSPFGSFGLTLTNEPI